MTKKSVKLEVNNFIQGLITEASPLNFPANASVDEENFVLNRDGTRDRRFGMDIERGGTYVESPSGEEDVAANPPSTFQWLAVNGDEQVNILVVQVLRKLMFFDLNNTIISSSPPLGILSLVPAGFSPSVKYSFTSINGDLVVVAGTKLIAIVSYNGTTFSLETVSIKTRDIWGAEVVSDPAYEYDNQYRGTLSGPHIYNLYNQSWGVPRQHALGGTPAYGDPVGVYNAALSKYPSNSEVVWTGLKYQPVVGAADPYERMYPQLYEQTFGTTPKAAKGYFIIDLLDRGQARMDEVARNKVKHPVMDISVIALPLDITPQGATIVCEFAGRVWYGGFGGDVTDGDARSPSLSSYIAFSQLVQNTYDINRCYQEGDPTSRESNELVDTDGGFIRLSGADQIVGMVNIGGTLIVLASNGVWSISGGGQYGFSATNYKVDRLSTFGAISRESIVTDGSRILYWAADSIYVVAKNQFGEFTVENMILKSIQKFYSNIPPRTKARAIGAFEVSNKKIRWLYNTGDRFTSFSNTKELILDLTTGAWSVFRINKTATNSVEVMSMFTSIPFSAPLISQQVSDRGVSILDTRYLVFVRISGALYLSFAYYNNDKFYDWQTVNNQGVDAKAYLTTGAITADDSSIEKQSPSLTMHFRRTEKGVDEFTHEPLNPSGCLVRSQWDWANGIQSNKWGSEFQAYRQRQAYLPTNENSPYNTGFELVTSKSKLRGRGKALAIHMETEAGKDCRIAGWNISVNGNIY